MNRFGSHPKRAAIKRSLDALLNGSYPKIDDSLELIDGNEVCRSLVALSPVPEVCRALVALSPVPRTIPVDVNHDVHFALDYDNG